MVLFSISHPKKRSIMTKERDMMYFPCFTLFNFFSAIFFLLAVFATAKIVTSDWKLGRKEGLYFAFTILFCSVVTTLSRNVHHTLFLFFRDLYLLPALVFYFRQLKNYSIKKALILTFMSLYIVLMVAFAVTVLFYFSFPSFTLNFIPNATLEAFHQASASEVAHIFSILLLPPLAAILFVKLFQSGRRAINQSNHLQAIFMWISIVHIAIFIVALCFVHSHGSPEWLISWQAFSFFLLGLVFFTSLYTYVSLMKARHRRLQRENEQKSLQFYTDELERQQIAVQKFKHDYQNILLSMQAFIEESDWEGLEHYFSTKIEATSKTIAKDCFALQDLHKIKVREIKGILAAKLVLAQNMGLAVSFEADGDVENIPLDSVALVRMLGIILDNAIDALAELGHGKLLVGCFKEDENLLIIIQNTCRSDILAPHQLERQGFSTKGEGRGFGLSNLFEIAKSFPNVLLETRIVENNFIQKLTILQKGGTA